MKTSHFDRRNFLKWSTLSLSALGLAGGMPVFLRRALAQPMIAGRKLLFIFLRGGIDGVQLVIPYGDAGRPSKPSYLGARPTIGIDPMLASDLNGFASLNPSAQAAATGPKLLDIFQGAVDARGPDLAFLHRVGYENQNRSHFSSQQFVENGDPTNVKLEKGVFNNYVTAYPDPSSPLQAATMGRNQMVMFKGESLIPVLQTVEDFRLPANVSLGTFPTPANPRGSGLKGAYGQTGFNASTAYNTLTYSTGTRLLESLQFFEDNVRAAPYSPEAAAQPYYAAIGNRRFRESIRDCARILKQVDQLQIVGTNQGGYDTHGAENTRFPALIGDLSLALTALYHDLQGIWDRTLVLCVSEFGRTSKENGNRGTDHAEATVSIAMGGPVVGGVYNCDRSTWENGALFSTKNNRYLSHRTDYRAVYAEIIRDHLGDPQNRIDEIIPGYNTLEARNTNGYFTPLNFIA